MQSMLAQLSTADDPRTDCVVAEVHARLPLEKVASALAEYAANMTSGKILLVP